MVKPSPHEIRRFQSQRGGVRATGRGGQTSGWSPGGSGPALFETSREHPSSWTIRRHLFACRHQGEAYQLLRRARVRRLAAPKSIKLLIGSLHGLFRPQQQGRRSVNPFMSVPAVPACGLHVNAISGGEGGVVIAKKLNYALASNIESPAFVPFRANPEGTDR